MSRTGVPTSTATQNALGWARRASLIRLRTPLSALAAQSPRRGTELRSWVERSCRFLKKRERLRTTVSGDLMPTSGTWASAVTAPGSPSVVHPQQGRGDGVVVEIGPVRGNGGGHVCCNRAIRVSTARNLRWREPGG